MIRWFSYGFSLAAGMFVACAIADQIDQRRKHSDIDWERA
jgi:hypothetical protein